MAKSQDQIRQVKKVAFTGIDPGLNGAIATVTGHLYSDGRTILDGPEHRLDSVHLINRDKGDKRLKHNMHELMQLVHDHYRVATAGIDTRYDDFVHRIVLERSQVRPTERRTASAAAAVGQAVWEAALQLHAKEYTLLWPTNWKRWAGLICTEKRAVCHKAAELNNKWLGGALRCHSSMLLDHNVADAFCMAIYAFCHMAGDE